VCLLVSCVCLLLASCFLLLACVLCVLCQLALSVTTTGEIRRAHHTSDGLFLVPDGAAGSGLWVPTPDSRRRERPRGDLPPATTSQTQKGACGQNSTAPVEPPWRHLAVDPIPPADWGTRSTRSHLGKHPEHEVPDL
jgi:hypothetical protein